VAQGVVLADDVDLDAMADARWRMSATISFIFGVDRSRTSIVIRTTPGITFGAFGSTLSWPTVPTCRPGFAFTASRTIRASWTRLSKSR